MIASGIKNGFNAAKSRFGGNSAGKRAEGKVAEHILNNRGKAAVGGTLAMGAISVPMNMNNGDSLGTATVRAGAETAAWLMAPVAMGIYEGAKLAPALTQAGYDWHRNRVSAHNQLHQRSSTVGGNYMDTQRAATMRQASIQAISGSKMNARSALGGEAQLLSAGWRR